MWEGSGFPEPYVALGRFFMFLQRYPTPNNSFSPPYGFPPITVRALELARERALGNNAGAAERFKRLPVSEEVYKPVYALPYG